MSDLITLPRATVRQALEAWEYINKYGFVLADYEGPMEQAIAALKAALEQPNECYWYQDGDEDSGTYMASCSRRYFNLEDGTPEANKMAWCCYCGKPLVEVLIEPEDNVGIEPPYSVGSNDGLGVCPMDATDRSEP